MPQLTIRFGDELARRIRRHARVGDLSLNQAVVHLLRKATGLDEGAADPDVVGDALDGHIGTWTAAEADELREAVADLDRADETFWR